MKYFIHFMFVIFFSLFAPQAASPAKQGLNQAQDNNVHQSVCQRRFRLHRPAGSLLPPKLIFLILFAF
jgi:hypothetical protein